MKLEREIKTVLYGIDSNHSNCLSNMLQWLKKNKERCTEKEYCYAVVNAYTSTDDLYRHKEDIKRLFTDPMVKPEYIMSSQEYEDYNNLPEIITVYRGMTVKEAESKDYGISWTLFREVADFFATRYGRNYSTQHLEKTVVQRKVHKSEIVGLINDRNEHEVLIF